MLICLLSEENRDHNNNNNHNNNTNDKSGDIDERALESRFYEKFSLQLNVHSQKIWQIVIDICDANVLRKTNKYRLKQHVARNTREINIVSAWQANERTIQRMQEQSDNHNQMISARGYIITQLPNNTNTNTINTTNVNMNMNMNTSQTNSRYDVTIVDHNTMPDPNSYAYYSNTHLPPPTVLPSYASPSPGLMHLQNSTASAVSVGIPTHHHHHQQTNPSPNLRTSPLLIPYHPSTQTAYHTNPQLITNSVGQRLAYANTLTSMPPAPLVPRLLQQPQYTTTTTVGSTATVPSVPLLQTSTLATAVAPVPFNNFGYFYNSTGNPTIGMQPPPPQHQQQHQHQHHQHQQQLSAPTHQLSAPTQQLPQATSLQPQTSNPSAPITLQQFQGYYQMPLLPSQSLPLPTQSQSQPQPQLGYEIYNTNNRSTTTTPQLLPVPQALPPGMTTNLNRISQPSPSYHGAQMPQMNQLNLNAPPPAVHHHHTTHTHANANSYNHNTYYTYQPPPRVVLIDIYLFSVKHWHRKYQ